MPPATALSQGTIDAYRIFAQERNAEAPRHAAKRQQLAARWRAIRYVLLISGVLLAAAAGITALPADVASWVTPTLAFLSAAVTGLSTVLHPSKTAAEHCNAAAGWQVFAADCRTFSATLPELTREDAKREFDSLQKRYLVLNGSMPGDD